MDIKQLAETLAKGGYGHTEVAVGDKFVLIGKVEPDDISPMEAINDADCWGKVEWGHNNRETGRSERPDGFTGAACKVYFNRGDWVWWEPYRDEHKVYNSPEDRATVERLLEDGFYYVALDVLELCTVLGTDGRVVGERYEEVASYGCGGIDTDDPKYLVDFYTDFLLEAQIDQEWLDSHSEGE